MTLRWACLLISLSVAVMATGCSKANEPTTTTLHLIEHADTDTAQHVGSANEKDSVGDILGFSNPLYDEKNVNKVGTDNGVCFRTAVGTAYECFWTATLSGGQLTVEGPYYDGKDSVLAITGGTGDFAQARGQVALHPRNPQSTEYDFVYTIVK
jgi:allene oxide cyclase